MKRKSGFTLVELLVVIGIIALLISILLPALNKARIAAVQVQCMANQRQITTAFFMYAQEHNGFLPASSYKAAPDDFNAGPSGYYVSWWCQPLAGQYLGIRTRGKDYNPSTYGQGWIGLHVYDSRASFLYCPAYQHGDNSDLGYGVNVRNGAAIFQTSNKVYKKLALVRNAPTVIMLADVKSGDAWEKFYYADPGGTSLGSTSQGMVAYRHGNNTVVSFCDGHAEAFKNSKPDETISGYQTGLHAANLSGQVSAKWDGR